MEVKQIVKELGFKDSGLSNILSLKFRYKGKIYMLLLNTWFIKHNKLELKNIVSVFYKDEQFFKGNFYDLYKYVSKSKNFIKELNAIATKVGEL